MRLGGDDKSPLAIYYVSDYLSIKFRLYYKEKVTLEPT